MQQISFKKWIWKCPLQNGGHFVSASKSYQNCIKRSYSSKRKIHTVLCHLNQQQWSHEGATTYYVNFPKWNSVRHELIDMEIFTAHILPQLSSRSDIVSSCHVTWEFCSGNAPSEPDKALILIRIKLPMLLIFAGFVSIFIRNLGAVSIRKTVLPGMAIPMLKIRRPNGRLIFNMEIAKRR